MKKKHKKIVLAMSLLALVLLLSACGTGTVDQNSTGIWSRYIVYYFGEAIKGLSFGNVGVGIILFTIIIRIILLPLMHFQTKSMRKTQELQPKIKALQEKYSARDTATQQKMQAEQKKLYAENNVNPYIGCLPLLVQMPVMMALYQAILRVPALSQGQFLWLNLSEHDQFYILPVLAAVFTFLSTYLSSMSQIEVNASVKIMNFAMPVMIFVMALNLASGLTLYWVISNAFQVVQTLLINNPFKIRQERRAEAKRIRDKERALEKAKNPKKKKKK
ncbi:preprotein translocase subunit YidC [Enterococcus sp. AZ103]